MSSSTETELIALTQKLLDSIANGDWATYSELCDPTLSAFEPEAHGQLVEGMNFHRFYFDLGGIRGPHQTTICCPRVRLLGDVAIVCYTRLVQKLENGTAMTTANNETRIWQRQANGWKHVHFHRSKV